MYQESCWDTASKVYWNSTEIAAENANNKIIFLKFLPCHETHCIKSHAEEIKKTYCIEWQCSTHLNHIFSFCNTQQLNRNEPSLCEICSLSTIMSNFTMTCVHCWMSTLVLLLPSRILLPVYYCTFPISSSCFLKNILLKSAFLPINQHNPGFKCKWLYVKT